MNEGRIWHNELCNDDGTNKFSFCETKHTTDSYDYDFLQETLGPEKAITFSVRAGNDAHMCADLQCPSRPRRVDCH